MSFNIVSGYLYKIIVTIINTNETVNDVDDIQSKSNYCKEAHHGRYQVYVVDKFFMIVPEM